MKRLNYLFGTLSIILFILVSTLLYRFYNSEKIAVSDLPENWENQFEMERIEIKNNYDLIKDKVGYYDYGTIGTLIDGRSELDTLFDSWDSMKLQGIVFSDSAHVVFNTLDSSFDLGWYSYGENSDLLMKYNFEIEKIIKGRNNWFYIKARRL